MNINMMLAWKSGELLDDREKSRTLAQHVFCQHGHVHVDPEKVICVDEAVSVQSMVYDMYISHL
jgi:hypothetical protein